MNRAPGLAGLLRETTGLLELARFPWHVRTLADQPRGAGEPVLLLPGFGAGDVSMLPLRSYLRWLGYRARGWRLGINRGGAAGLVQRVVDLAAGMARRADQPVSIVGWSLGGHLAREVAYARPDLVSRVITLGAPVLAGARRGRPLDVAGADGPRPEAARVVPITAIYSRDDGIVPWSACIDDTGSTEHIEVAATHLGLILSPDVYRIVAQRLGGTLAAADRARAADGALPCAT